MLERGGRRDIFLGTRECQGYVEPCEFGEGKGAYDDSPAVPLGVMLHGITYADEDEGGMMSERLWRPVMEHGVIQFIRPEECPVIRPKRKKKYRIIDGSYTKRKRKALSSGHRHRLHHCEGGHT